MGVFWLAIDTENNCSSYLELKHRQVVAQGWKKLGDLASFNLFYPNHKDLFKQNIKALGDIGNGNKIWWHRDECPSVMWNLMKLKTGDLVVALEGEKVMGIAEMPSDSLASYRFDSGFEYAHTVGFGVKWVDWNEKNTFKFAPLIKRPFGIKNLKKERDSVIKAWEDYKNKK
ncbi:MAG: hypothetical protein PHC99_07580 [Methylococcales bacterium]|nr:hypothetical protein [Methylococcales bacterium]